MMSALVLGGTGNIGQEVLRGLRARGITATFTYHRNEERAAAISSTLGHTAAALDLRDADATRRFLTELPAAQVIIHCAGVSQAAALSEISLSQFDAMMAINVRSALLVCQVLTPRMEATGGHIVLLGAIDGTQTVPAPAHFAASQGALVGLTRSLAKELGPKKILINLVAVGVVEGGISRELAPKLLDDYKHFSAMRRIGTPTEIARAVLWVALENTYMTGKIIPINGGL